VQAHSSAQASSLVLVLVLALALGPRDMFAASVRPCGYARVALGVCGQE